MKANINRSTLFMYRTANAHHQIKRLIIKKIRSIMALQVLRQISLDSGERWSRGMEFTTIPCALIGCLASLKSILRLRPIDIVGAGNGQQARFDQT